MASSSQMEYEDHSDGGDSEMDFDSLVNNAVIYILSVDEKHLPIKRADVIKHALPKNGKKFMGVIKEVKKILKKNFGFELVDLDGTDKLYVPLSKFTSPESTALLSVSEESRRKKTLLLVVLSYIFMENNSITEDQLWKFLMQLKIVERSVNYEHPQFGNVRRLCTTDFVRQMYLKTEKVLETNPQEILFSWGLRAHAEFNKLEVLKFVAKMQSNIEPERFSSHWTKVQEEIQQTTDNMIVENSQPQQVLQKSSQRARRR